MTSTGVRASGAENFELPSGHPFDPRSGPESRVYLDGIWGIYAAVGGRSWEESVHLKGARGAHVRP